MLPTTPYRIAFNEDRTRDLALTKRMLCQLSYEGETRAKQINSYNNQQKFIFGKRKNKKMPPPGIAPGLPAPQAGVLLLYYSGSWRIRVSIPVLNLAKVVCYHVQQSPNASTGTRTRILTLEGLNTTLVLWTHDDGMEHVHVSATRHVQKKKLRDINRIRTDEGIAH